MADSGDDEDYVPESWPKPKSWSCGANEVGEGEQSSEHPKGRQCEQRKVRSLSQQNILLGSHALSANMDILQMVKRLALHLFIVPVLRLVGTCGSFEVVRPSCYQYSVSVSPATGG